MVRVGRGVTIDHVGRRRRNPRHRTDSNQDPPAGRRNAEESVACDLNHQTGSAIVRGDALASVAMPGHGGRFARGITFDPDGGHGSRISGRLPARWVA